MPTRCDPDYPRLRALGDVSIHHLDSAQLEVVDDADGITAVTEYLAGPTGAVTGVTAGSTASPQLGCSRKTLTMKTIRKRLSRPATFSRTKLHPPHQDPHRERGDGNPHHRADIGGQLQNQCDIADLGDSVIRFGGEHAFTATRRAARRAQDTTRSVLDHFLVGVEVDRFQLFLPVGG